MTKPIEQAIERHGVNGLAKALDVHRNTITRWRTNTPRVVELALAHLATLDATAQEQTPMTKHATNLATLTALWGTDAGDLDLIDPGAELELSVRDGVGILYEVVGTGTRHLIDLTAADTDDLLAAIHAEATP